jgi:hypothetical protein
MPLSPLTKTKPGGVDITDSRTGPGVAVLDAGRREATRYLCAAAYLDPSFRDSVLDELFNRNRRFVAPSPGVDVPTVVRHCLAARRRTRIRDAILTVIAVLCLAGLFPLVVVAWLVVVGDTIITRYGIVSRHLRRQEFDPSEAPPVSSDVEEQLAELTADEEGNVVVYSDYSPFVGSGFEVGAWSFAVNVLRATEGLHQGTPTSFDAGEIHDTVADAIRALPLDRLSVTDCIFVSGRHIRDDRRFLPDPFRRPRARVEDDVVEELRRSPSPTARVYLQIRVLDWQGELVFSTFVRFSIKGDCLFVETSHFVLPSLAGKYHDVDRLPATPTAKMVGAIAGEGLLAFLLVTARATVKTIGLAGKPLQRFFEERAVRRAITENNAYDYGDTTSIRQRGTPSEYHGYFQLLDKELYHKVVERRLIDAILAFLDDKGVDTSDLRQQSQHIYNNGVIVSGGTLQAQNVVSGTGARAAVHAMAGAVSQATSPTLNK